MIFFIINMFLKKIEEKDKVNYSINKTKDKLILVTEIVSSVPLFCLALASGYPVMLLRVLFTDDSFPDGFIYPFKCE